VLVEAVVPHLEILINRKLKDSITAREFCKTLSGKVLEINIQAIPQRIFIAPIAENIEILVDEELKADVVFAGSILHFMQATQTKPMELVRKGQLKLKGDAVLAGQFQRLIELAMPDWQEEIAKLFGDYAGPQISTFFMDLANLGKQAVQQFSQGSSEFMQKNSGVAPGRSEYDSFAAEVKKLQKDLRELAASINKY
jgi:ubiquinone biosynthesis protein UbiJ